MEIITEEEEEEDGERKRKNKKIHYNSASAYKMFNYQSVRLYLQRSPQNIEPQTVLHK